ncbi:hypothetical protein GAG84_28210, partial [Bacteroides thetaiotaomicron]
MGCIRVIIGIVSDLHKSLIDILAAHMVKVYRLRRASDGGTVDGTVVDILRIGVRDSPGGDGAGDAVGARTAAGAHIAEGEYAAVPPLCGELHIARAAFGNGYDLR